MAEGLRRRILAASLLVLASLAFGVAEGAVLKNKGTGETIRGTLTEQQINDKRIFLPESGGKKYIDLEEWEIIEADEPQEEAAADVEAGAETPAEGTDTEASSEKETKPVPVYVIPIKGPIQHSSLIEAVEQAAEKAKKYHAEIVVFHLDTPGGIVFIADKVISAIQEIDWAKTVAWIEGNEHHGALSAGAFISLATHDIYMANGTTLGAAVPFRQMSTGEIEVDAKFQSAFRARFRALAQERGHSAVLADAMVDSSVSVIQVFIDGEQKLVSKDEIETLRENNPEKFKRGKTISKPGKVLTLTADEAVDYGIAKAHAGNLDELAKAMGIENPNFIEADWLPDYVKEDAEKKKRIFERCRTAFNTNWQQAMESDPKRQMYYVDEDMKFEDGGRRWQKYSRQCLGHLRNCAEAIKALEKLSDLDRIAFNFREETLNDWKARLQTLYDRVNRQQNARKMP